jgi:hypothetical protein
MWVPTEVPKLIHQQHLRDAQARMQYRRSRTADHERTPVASPRRALGLGLVRLGLWMVAGAARPADSC